MPHNHLKIRRQNSGFTLIETFGAITILIFAVLGPLALLAASLADNAIVKNQMVANYLAQEGIELVIRERNKQIIDEAAADQWLGNFAGCTEDDPCNIDPETFEVMPCDNGNDNCLIYAEVEEVAISDDPEDDIKEWVKFFAEDGLDREPTIFHRYVYLETNSEDDFYNDVSVLFDEAVLEAGGEIYFAGPERVKVVVQVEWLLKGLPKSHSLATYIYNLQSVKQPITSP